MTEASKRWEGQIVDGTLPLRQFLGGSDHSAVFLTEYGEGQPQKAVIKLFTADPATADAQISRWESVADLSHPNLLRLLSGGRCRLDGNDLLYLVMEYADEDLSQIIPQRALTPEETRDMLGPVLDALEYLHGKGFVHGDLKPSNVLATGDRLKLSSDAISRIGEARTATKRPDSYDPPEAISGTLTPAADVWSLGTTLVEVLTQHLPEWQPGPHREPVVPVNIPAPFQQIARECLRLEPQLRINLAEIGARLNSRAATATASASAAAIPLAPQSSLSVSPLVGAPAQATPPTAKSGAPVSVASRGLARMQQNDPHRPAPHTASGTRPRYLVPLIVGALVFAAILTLPRLLTHRPDAQPAATVASEKPPAQSAGKNPVDPGSSKRAVSRSEKSTAPVTTPATTAADHRSVSPAAPHSLQPTSEKESPSPAAAPIAPAATDRGVTPNTAAVASSKGEVLDQVLPDVSEKARATIHGKVRVSVKVQVDPSGSVTGAEFDSPGPSQFFADLALQAARKWAFTPPEVNGKSVASEWRLKFEFTPKDTKVAPTQTAPL